MTPDGSVSVTVVTPLVVAFPVLLTFKVMAPVLPWVRGDGLWVAAMPKPGAGVEEVTFTHQPLAMLPLAPLAVVLLKSSQVPLAESPPNADKNVAVPAGAADVSEAGAGAAKVSAV